MSVSLNSKLKKGFSSKRIFDIIYSFKSLSVDERTLLHCHLTMFIGLEDDSCEKVIKGNITYISDKINHKVEG